MQLIGVVALARLLTQEDFGVYAMAFSVLGVAQVLGDFGLSMAAVQSRTITHRQRSNLFWTNAAVGSLLFLVAFLCAPLLTLIFDEPVLEEVARVLAVTFLLNSLSAQFRAELMSRLRFGALAIAEVTGAASGLAVAVTMAISGFGYWALISQSVVTAAVTTTFLVFATRWVPALPKFNEPMRELYRYGINTLSVQVFIYLTSNVDTVLVGRFLGASALGSYDRAFRIFRLPLQQIASPLTKVGVPILSRLQDQPERYAAYVGRSQLVLGYVFGGAFFAIAAAADPIVELLLGPGWEATKPILSLLAVGGVFQAMTYVYAWVFLSKGLTSLQLKWTVLGRSLMVVLMLTGLIWGVTGVAAGYATGLALNWLILSLFPMKKSGVAARALILIALRPVFFYTPVAALVLLSSMRLSGEIPALLHLALLVLIFLVGLGLALVVPLFRNDMKVLVQTVRQGRSRE